MIVAEYVSRVDLVRALNRSAALFHEPDQRCKQIATFTRFSRDFFQPLFESERISISKLALPARSEVLIVSAHLPSKLYWSDQSQVFECTELARQIRLEEDKVGHRRTILVGDFNMNPFEPGLVGAGGLNAVMSRRVASRMTRQVQGRDYHFFYNPMWNHFGDGRSPTAGSYYYDSAEHVNYYWNVFDQVMVRPDLASQFDPAQLRIITTVGARSLIRSDGRPDLSVGSDHLPLVFEVEF